MRFDAARIGLKGRVAAGAAAWLTVICVAHATLNGEHGQRRRLRMGYMPVITNLSAPLLDAATRDGTGLRFEAIKFSSFSDMGAALRDGHIDVAFLIAPLSIALRQQGVPVKVVYIGNRHESTLVVRKDLGAQRVADLAGRRIAVPLRFSGHNLALRRAAAQAGLGPDSIDIVEMNPPDMPAALRTGLDGYFVGEPFAGQAVASGDAVVLARVEELWPGFICNLAIVTERLIAEHRSDVEQFVASAARAGVWSAAHPDSAATVAAGYWGRDPRLVRELLTSGRIVFDRFEPRQDELQVMADLMQRFGLIQKADIAGLVDDSFARGAALGGVSSLESIAAGPRSLLAERRR